MDVLYRKGRATATEIMADMPDPPSNSAVRAILRTLEEKGQIRHEAEDLRYVYMPMMPLDKARRSALAHVVETFFEGSTEQAVATMLDLSARRMKAEELDALAELIEKARKEGR